MTETDQANSWGAWLATKLDEREWRQADLVRESGGLIKRDRASKWLSGNERPSHRLAIVVANTLDLPHEEALEAAGFTAESSKREKDLDEALAQIDRQFGAGGTMTLAHRQERTPSLTRLELFRELDQHPDYLILQYLAERALRSRYRTDVGQPAGDVGDSADDVEERERQQAEYARAARARSRDRGEDLL
ncbi:hypothetical protein ILP86_04500 [Microbacterium sp. R1]|uniref:Transcriptional regulator n=1 Tax=Microbacterium phage vB_MoxS-R1 TaxID=2848881 RepID=A0A8F2E4H2_9CAUD|nr:hypothetical protein [Microbacterium sp. R1]YP_010649883.1 transcriptional regulator [Microbacterium phage vB_MoxS-R1]MBE7953580.1 hypothetical protein [Microbacterium sp. R1]QWT28853.1 transcriptional regulator [Microbacterium phage vB_MoxS-R1]